MTKLHISGDLTLPGMKIVHQCCGSHGNRHLKTCKRPGYRAPRPRKPQKSPPLRMENGQRITVEICRDYYQWFAHRGVFTPPQRKLFLFLLELAEKNP